MYEVELKVPADHDRVRARLEALGATDRGEVTQTDTYYEAPHRDFATSDEALRVRREEPKDGAGRTHLTYKGPLVESASKTRSEAETVVDDGDALRGILEGIGFDPAATVTKRRRRFGLRGYTVTLDSVAGLGDFVEVEQRAETVAEARDGAIDLVEDLGLDSDEQVRTSYLELLQTS